MGRKIRYFIDFTPVDCFKVFLNAHYIGPNVILQLYVKYNIFIIERLHAKLKLSLKNSLKNTFYF